MYTKRMGAFGIIVSGGPAPGINSVISSAVIEASHHKALVYGFKKGFHGLVSESEDCFIKLEVPQVSHITGSGGSILGTSRFNPFSDPANLGRIKARLNQLGIDKLIVIGGEGSAYLSNKLCKLLPQVQIAHVPKTIDNDLPLPMGHSCFGFETARYAGERILRTLMTDAITTERWFVVNSMGRKAGFLALGLGVASGATLTLIPEEFAGKLVTLDQIAEIIMASVQKRLLEDKRYGIAIVAEGLLDYLDTAKTPALRDAARDELGRIKYSDLKLEELLVQRLRELCAKRKLEVSFNSKDIGYELRCHSPISFDIEYTRFLGLGAVRYLLQGKSGFMVVREHDSLSTLDFAEISDENGVIKSRSVDLKSDLYQVARSYMIR